MDHGACLGARMGALLLRADVREQDRDRRTGFEIPLTMDEDDKPPGKSRRASMPPNIPLLSEAMPASV